MADLLQGTWVFDKITQIHTGSGHIYGYWDVNFISNGVSFTKLNIATEETSTWASSSTYSIGYGGDYHVYLIQPHYGLYTDYATITITSKYDEVEDAANLVRALTARATFYPITNDIEVKMKSSKGVRLFTEGKLCEKDILVTPDFEIYEKPNIQPLNITENGTYTAQDGVDGFSPITVEVAASGGGDSLEGFFDGSLIEVSLPNIIKLKSGAFGSNDGSVKRVSIPNVIDISGNAFYGANVESVELSGRLKTIGIKAFQNCSNLVLTELPDSVTSIGTYAFSKCSKLALTSLPSGLKKIEEYTFEKCTALALTSLPSGLTELGNYAFTGCANLSLTELPTSLTTIGYWAFQQCSKLAITEIPSSVTTLGNGVFDACTSLTSITFKGTPSNISTNCFRSCTNLTTINVPWAEGAVANAPWGANATINYNYTGG